jgi:anti-sigma factor RsiW
MKDDLDCIELVARLGDYFDGVLSPEERTRFEVHMEACLACRRFREQLELVRFTLRHTALDHTDECPPRLRALFADWKRGRA